jgi:hypothetical protein
MSKMQAVGACMRKLVMVRCGVLKNRAPFAPLGVKSRPLTTRYPVRRASAHRPGPA